MKRDSKVLITDIKEVKGGAYQLTLEQKYERESNPGAVVGFFMEGHPGITPTNGKLITWQTVSAAKMAQYNFAKGQDVSSVIGIECNIQVTEGFSPRKWKDAEGNDVTQNAKTAGTDGEVLTKNGQPIYRNTALVFGEAKDTLIQHDNVLSGAKSAAKTVSGLLEN